MQAMFCTQCGTKLDEAARFCVFCGKSTTAVATASVPAEPVADFGGYYASAAPPKRLRKIVAQKKICGVCAGFAEFFDIDITLMRVIWVALLLLPPNLGIIAYIVCIFVLPKG